MVLTLDFVRQFHTRKGFEPDPHNDLLLLLYQIGPIGLGIYLWMQWKVLKTVAAVRLLAPTDRFATHSPHTYRLRRSWCLSPISSTTAFTEHRAVLLVHVWLFAEYGQLKRGEAKKPEPLTAVPAPA